MKQQLCFIRISINSMMRIIAFTLLLTVDYYSQGVLKITTDKVVYSYGDMIEVKVWFTNNTDKPLSIYGSSNCIARISFNGVKTTTYCTADYREFSFASGKSKIWIWYLDPKTIGVPTVEGKQKIVAYCNTYKDSIYITAPKFRGGILSVGLNDSVPDAEYQKMRDSLSASLIARSYNTREYEEWQVNNKSIDSLVEKYKIDSRLKWIQAKRDLYFAKQFETEVLNETSLNSEFSLSQNYPNPFNPETTINYQLPTPGFVTLKVFDLLGQEVATLVDEYKNTGTYKFTINVKTRHGASLQSGVYFYRLQTGSYSETKKLVLLK